VRISSGSFRGQGIAAVLESAGSGRSTGVCQKISRGCAERDFRCRSSGRGRHGKYFENVFLCCEARVDRDFPKRTVKSPEECGRCVRNGAHEINTGCHCRGAQREADASPGDLEYVHRRDTDSDSMRIRAVRLRIQVRGTNEEKNQDCLKCASLVQMRWPLDEKRSTHGFDSCTNIGAINLRFKTSQDGTPAQLPVIVYVITCVSEPIPSDTFADATNRILHLP